MVTCRDFLDDTSLSIVGKNDKNLKIGNGEFRSSQMMNSINIPK